MKKKRIISYVIVICLFMLIIGTIIACSTSNNIPGKIPFSGTEILILIVLVLFALIGIIIRDS